MQYQFLIDTYETERIKILGVWSMFRDEHLSFRPHPDDRRGRSVLEQMVHQCVSEDFWFRTMLGIDTGASPLPATETRLEFISKYADNSLRRLEVLRSKLDSWWPEVVQFFDVPRSRAWIIVRRIAHTAHHRGQQTTMLRMLNHEQLHTWILLHLAHDHSVHRSVSGPSTNAQSIALLPRWFVARLKSYSPCIRGVRRRIHDHPRRVKSRPYLASRATAKIA